MGSVQIQVTLLSGLARDALISALQIQVFFLDIHICIEIIHRAPRGLGQVRLTKKTSHYRLPFFFLFFELPPPPPPPAFCCALAGDSSAFSFTGPP